MDSLTRIETDLSAFHPSPASFTVSLDEYSVRSASILTSMGTLTIDTCTLVPDVDPVKVTVRDLKNSVGVEKL